MCDVSAASIGKNVALLDFVNPSPRGEYVSDRKRSSSSDEIIIS